MKRSLVRASLGVGESEEFPVSLEEVKDQLRIISDNSQNDLLIRLRRAAIEQVEAITGRALSFQRWVLKGDSFDSLLVSDVDFGSIIRFPKSPLIEVTAVNYIDEDEISQTFDEDKYSVNTNIEPGFIRLCDGESWPSVADQLSSVSIEFAAGYETINDIPESLKQAILILVAEMFNARTASVVGLMVTPREYVLNALLANQIVRLSA